MIAGLPLFAGRSPQRMIAAHLIEFLQHEVKRGRLPANLLPVTTSTRIPVVVP